MTKINVTFTDESADSIIVSTGLAYEVQPVHDLPASKQL